MNIPQAIEKFYNSIVVFPIASFKDKNQKPTHQSSSRILILVHALFIEKADSS